MAFQFDNVIGQEEVKRHLLQMAEEDRLPHAIMLCGKSGVGKLPLALAFARFLLCKTPADGKPCEKCPDCRMTGIWSHPDLHFSFPVCKEKSSDHPVSDDYIGQWRQQLEENVYFSTSAWLERINADNQQLTFYVQESDALQRKMALKPSQGGRKVVVMWLPEKMGQEMANKLLKLIEEPPFKTHFILVSDEPDMVLGTIQSRVQRVNVPPLTEEEISAALQAERSVPANIAIQTAHLACGSYTKALRHLYERENEQEFFTLFVDIMRTSYMRKIKDMNQWAQKVSSIGREKQKRLLAYFQRMARESFVYNFHRPEMTFLSDEEANFCVRFAPFINERNVTGIMDELSKAERDITQNVSARMVFFCFAIKLTILLKQ